MDELKSIFGDRTLSIGQLEDELTARGIKLGNLAGGQYVGADKFKRLEAERDAIKSKLEGYDPDWQAKLDASESRIRELNKDRAIHEATAGVHFSSDSARRAFTDALEKEALEIGRTGEISGFDDFVERYRKNDPGAFRMSERPPCFSSATAGPLRRPESRSDKINLAIRELMVRA